MRKRLYIALISACLTACATGPTKYQPAASATAAGYSEVKIEADRYRVNYTARSQDEAYELAVLRAAELALSANYSHFQIVREGQEVENNSGSPRVGLGLGTGGYRRSGASLGVSLPLGGSPKVRQSIEVKFRNDDDSAGERADIYAAQEVLENLRMSVSHR